MQSEHNSCEASRQDLPLYIYGELEAAAEEALEQHLAVCEDCRAELAQLQSMLMQVEDCAPAPSAELLSKCRQSLQETLMQNEPAAPRWRNFLATFAPPAWVWRPAAALALLTGGFFAGQLFERNQSLDFGSQSIARIRAIEGLGDGNVRIVYDEPRVRTVSGSLQQDQIEQLLLAATRQASDPGLRLESVDLLRNRCNRDDVREVFLQTLVKDQNPEVRLKALEALRPYTHEDAVRQTLSSVVLADNNPNVRMLAIDVLVDRHASEMVGTLQQVIRNEEDEYVRTRVMRALGSLRASPGTF
jgi:hypothetical protein